MKRMKNRVVKTSETAMKAGVVVVGAVTTEGADEGRTERSKQHSVRQCTIKMCP